MMMMMVCGGYDNDDGDCGSGDGGFVLKMMVVK
jgi:hypothetical protein